MLMATAEDDPDTKARLAALRQGLERRGWSEGRNVQLDYRFTAARSERIPAFAKELVGLQPDVILAHSTGAAAGLQREGRTIPIVFVNVSDPIGVGFIASMARPGGNLTGVLHLEAGIIGKWLAMLKEIAPDLQRAALRRIPRSPPLITSCDPDKPQRRRSPSKLCPVMSKLPPTSSVHRIVRARA